MGTHAYKNNELVQYSVFDKTLTLTLKDIFPNNIEETKNLLKVKCNSPEGKLQKIYKVKDNSSLVRKIFRVYLKEVIWDIVSGDCLYMFPGNSKAEIYVDSINDNVLKFRRVKGHLHEFDLLSTNYKVPRVIYSFSRKSKRQKLEVYVSKPYYKKLVDVANSGKIFSKRPKNINHFLPSIYEQFPYIKEDSINKIIRLGSRRVSYNLRRGEELRIIDREGEIKIFRPLGKNHDRVMKSVRSKRIIREKNKHESESIS